MYLLKKIFQLRDKTHQGDEKPFLDHLEDLRVVITRVIVTLLIAVTVCFVFRNELMEIIRKPVEQTWRISQSERMPDGPAKISLETWERAKKAARDTADYTPAQKKYYFEFVDPGGAQKLEFHTDSVQYYRAALDMINDDMDGEKYVAGLPDLQPGMNEQLAALLDEESRPDAAIDSHGKLVLMQALNPTEGFMLSIKLSVYAGIIVSFPVLLYFLLQFVLPGLKKNEKKALWPAMLIGFGLFLAGVLFSYFFVLPKVLDFFYNYSQEMGVSNEWRIGYYISFATQFTLIFGLSFELPVVVMTMVKLGILNYDMMKSTRSYAILAIVVVAAVITPTPDAFTLGLLAGPMCILYEICIWLAFFHRRKERAQEKKEMEEMRARVLAAPATTSFHDEEDEDHHDDDSHDDYHHDSYHDEHHSGGEHEEDHHYHPDEYFDHHEDAHEDSDHNHDHDEGGEMDDGTYDFEESELDLEYSADSSAEPSEESSSESRDPNSDDDSDSDDSLEKKPNN